ncbi:putative pre-rRNA-processing protein ESF2 [Triangularia verruculosa]|uniref:18S rRNA factor 2 n=1 Tax=Triangularia verruculosa TaxID=2587418 RepID=A0AAN6XL71_9PEZI|nr:putative pre-rRNA-processing protein ESF2 [Triangularia verruculosa]
MSDKRNTFLDAGDSDEDVGRDYDSEDDFQKGGPSAKRRRVDDEDSEAEDVTDDEQDQDEDGGVNLDEEVKESGDEDDEEGQDTKEGKPKKTKLELPSIAKPLFKKNLVVTEAAIKKSGVIYLSRVPPFMKPQKLRSLLEPYGQINRIFLAPEDPAAHARRVHAGGNKKRSYSEGWVEFVKKKDAKKVVDLLNAQTIGGKKSSWYRDDVWAMKYLNGFKWHHLTEQIAAENAERASRMRAEISKSTKENKEFVRNVERAKVLQGMEAKAAAKRKKAAEDEKKDDGGVGHVAEGGAAHKKRRTFAQVPLAKKRKQEEQPEHVRRVLSKIF